MKMVQGDSNTVSLPSKDAALADLVTAGVLNELLYTVSS